MAAHYFQTTVPGRVGPLLTPLFTEEQTHAYALQALAAEREKMKSLVEAVRNANALAHQAGTCAPPNLGQTAAWTALLDALYQDPSTRVEAEQ